MVPVRLHLQASLTASLLLVTLAGDARAQNEGSSPRDGAIDAGPLPGQATSPLVLGGYVEAFYQWNLGAPSNGITNHRAFDNRHDTFTLSNVALDAKWDHERLVGRVTLQMGHTPSTYYLAEPSVAGASGANASSAELWKYVQQAYAGYRFDVGLGLTLTAGLFLSPIGPESIPIRENWSWSQSSLFFALPFYHAGVRLTQALTRRWAVTLAGYNGWNSVVDRNKDKSVSTQLTYTRPDLVLSLLYFGGVERPPEAPEGRAFRHLGDAHVTWDATRWLSLRAHANGGFEPNRFGTSAWAGGALYARFRPHDKLFAALRTDALFEHAAASDRGRADRFLLPTPWVLAGTATLDLRPHERISLRLEYRHDHAASNAYFGGEVAGDGVTTPYVANRRSHDTLTAGLTAWFEREER